MIPQSNSGGRNRARHNGGRNTRPAQAGQQSASNNQSPNNQSPNNQSQWQRKYDHYCELAQAAGRDDAVTREGHWQHAEHYLRLMNGSAS
ncbi:MAG TPA: DUF4167 domain-containing protein [Rhizomicrobium sp.]|nr:DUF4167 domain-containing protein [Rhizomicrobium sp.]